MFGFPLEQRALCRARVLDLSRRLARSLIQAVLIGAAREAMLRWVQIMGGFLLGIALTCLSETAASGGSMRFTTSFLLAWQETKASRGVQKQACPPRARPSPRRCCHHSAPLPPTLTRFITSFLPAAGPLL